MCACVCVYWCLIQGWLAESIPNPPVTQSCLFNCCFFNRFTHWLSNPVQQVVCVCVYWCGPGCRQQARPLFIVYDTLPSTYWDFYCWKTGFIHTAVADKCGRTRSRKTCLSPNSVGYNPIVTNVLVKCMFTYKLSKAFLQLYNLQLKCAGKQFSAILCSRVNCN